MHLLIKWQKDVIKDIKYEGKPDKIRYHKLRRSIY